jgi:hypothetical protein
MAATKYTEDELEEFKEIINTKIARAQEDLELLRSAYKNDASNGTDDTLASFKSFDEGSEVMNKKKRTTSHTSRKVYKRFKKCTFKNR